jgi:hypothetical protein
MGSTACIVQQMPHVEHKLMRRKTSSASAFPSGTLVPKEDWGVCSFSCSGQRRSNDACIWCNHDIDLLVTIARAKKHNMMVHLPLPANPGCTGRHLAEEPLQTKQLRIAQRLRASWWGSWRYDLAGRVRLRYSSGVADKWLHSRRQCTGVKKSQ